MLLSLRAQISLSQLRLCPWRKGNALCDFMDLNGHGEKPQDSFSSCLYLYQVLGVTVTCPWREGCGFMGVRLLVLVNPT